MPNTDWTIEKELTTLTGGADVGAAMEALGICKSDDFKSVLVTSDWHRAGGETYICNFDVYTDLTTIKLILKACVASSTTLKLDDILLEWIKRRTMLQDQGLNAPRLYFFGKGVLIEQYLALSASQVLHSSDRTRLSLLAALGDIAGVLQKLGFQSRNPFSDLRSDGTNLFLIDFGDDLGPPGGALEEDIMLDKLRDALVSWGISLDGQSWSVIRASFAGRLLQAIV